jgi:xanthine dehydrogenase YagR molybdenum-binding subunit
MPTQSREFETAAISPSNIIGASVPRIDGPLKTTGTASYASDYNFPRMVYAVPVCSTIANGKISSLDTTAAEKMPGVLLVLHHDNIGPLYRYFGSGRNSEGRPPFEDNVVSYWGQYVALAIAETLQQAQSAADAVRVQYDMEKPDVSTDLSGEVASTHIESKRGDTDSAFAAAPVQVDEIYGTPAETHNPMEMHATVAVWNGQKFTLYESSQGVVNHLHVLAQVLGVEKENVQIISKYIGSGFGGKLFPWPHSALAAAASRHLQRPVKLTLSRRMMFADVGHRPETQQRMRIGATRDGKLLSLQQDYRNHTSMTDNVKENCGEATPFLYSVANLQVTSALVKRNVGTPTPMRGPGAVPGLFAVESAMDELAIKLQMDPVEFRLRNDTLIDEESNKPFSSRHLKECYRVGAEKFGWSQRTPAIGSMRKGDLILGWGMAAASWGAGRGDCAVNVTLKADGSAYASCATQDIGTGTYTIFAQVVRERTGIPLSKIDVVLGDTSLPPGPTSGGSTATATVLPAVAAATDAAIQSLIKLAVSTNGSPYLHQDPATLALTDGRVHAMNQSPSSGTAYQDLLKMAMVPYVSGDSRTGGLGSDTEAHKYSTHSFGAQFVEVEWDPGIARLRVSRCVCVIDGGRIINMKTATNQVAGAIVMGVGMGLLEQTVYDPRNGDPINDSFADYLVATSADVPNIDVTFLNIPDPMMGSFGARGVGEIGLAGVAPAITAAVYHATGVRVRKLPVRIEDLLTSKVS